MVSAIINVSSNLTVFVFKDIRSWRLCVDFSFLVSPKSCTAPKEFSKSLGEKQLVRKLFGLRFSLNILKFPPPVTIHVAHVLCHVSPVTCHVSQTLIMFEL